MDSAHLIVIYDVSRLVARDSTLHLTGVDRVDFNYALWLQHYASGFQCVVQTARGFQLVDSSKLQSGRVKRFAHAVAGWQGGWEQIEGLDALGLESNSSRQTHRALLEKFRRVGFREVWKERGFWAALVSRLPCRQRELVFPDGDWSGWTYVNVGHCFQFEAAMDSIPLEMKRLYFLHDVIPLTHPETQKATSRAHFRKFCEYVGNSMSDVIVSSQATVDAIASLPAGERKLLDSVASIQVAPLAVEERFKAESCRVKDFVPRGSAAVHGPSGYFLSVGTVEPRKNLELLVRVWEQLIESGQDIPKLIWVGKFGWSCDPQLMRRFERLQRQGHAELRSGVSDSELLDLMAGAIALLFPSKIEGWGLPLSEALAIGLPVIASDIPVFREVGQGIPDLIDPDDEAGWSATISDYSQPNSKRRADQMGRMLNYEPVTWEQHFEGIKVAK